jgi:hypothetical protein
MLLLLLLTGTSIFLLLSPMTWVHRSRFVGNRQMHSAITSTTTNPKQLNHAKNIRESPVQAV